VVLLFLQLQCLLCFHGEEFILSACPHAYFGLPLNYVTFGQIIVALPFLKTNWWGYIACAFNFGRKFLYTWTVNLKFLPEVAFFCAWSLIYRFVDYGRKYS
jgi:hypothetical protein